MGPVRAFKTLLSVNKKKGFDCQSCAWPSPDENRKVAEFCENGAKAIADEATTKRLTEEFFRRHSLDDLRSRSDFWLGQQGRLTQPLVKPVGATHYQPISWDDAFELIAIELNALPSPNVAAFYTSGRTSNEAAFLYQDSGEHRPLACCSRRLAASLSRGAPNSMRDFALCAKLHSASCRMLQASSLRSPAAEFYALSLPIGGGTSAALRRCAKYGFNLPVSSLPEKISPGIHGMRWPHVDVVFRSTDTLRGRVDALR